MSSRLIGWIQPGLPGDINSSIAIPSLSSAEENGVLSWEQSNIKIAHRLLKYTKKLFRVSMGEGYTWFVLLNEYASLNI